jgi:exonuclease VII small subunit
MKIDELLAAKTEQLTFDEAMSQLEEMVSLLEKEENMDNQPLYEKAVITKEHCSFLLKKEKAEIIRVAKENNIPLADLGLTEFDDDEDDE